MENLLLLCCPILMHIMVPSCKMAVEKLESSTARNFMYITWQLMQSNDFICLNCIIVYHMMLLLISG